MVLLKRLSSGRKAFHLGEKVFVWEKRFLLGFRWFRKRFSSGRKGFRLGEKVFVTVQMVSLKRLSSGTKGFRL